MQLQYRSPQGALEMKAKLENMLPRHGVKCDHEAPNCA